LPLGREQDARKARAISNLYTIELDGLTALAAAATASICADPPLAHGSMNRPGADLP
jgi:hypothetical protein